MTGNKIGTEGARVISEMLQVNTTLTSLNLSKMIIEGRKRKGRKKHWMTGNENGEEEKKMVRDSWGTRGPWLILW